MGVENRKSRFELVMDGLAKKRLVSAYGREDKANILRINALNRYMQGENGIARLTQYMNFPVDQFSGSPDISFPKTLQNASLDKKKINSEDEQAFCGVVNVNAEKNSFWLDENLKTKGVVFEISQCPDSDIWNCFEEWIATDQPEAYDRLFDLSVGMFSQIIEVNIPDNLFLEKPLLIRVGFTTSPQFFSQIIFLRSLRF